ncbi:hypothetical protein TV01_0328 [Neisseria flavescens]|nr:hypothetical protein NEIFL0001_1479 [Neisseria flavescens SK114]KZC76614.1 hypothetical protein TV01_0328 [Neisseria flavescens]
MIRPSENAIFRRPEAFAVCQNMLLQVKITHSNMGITS